MAVGTPEVPSQGFARCPLCYGRVRLDSDVSVDAAVWTHQLSGTCRGHVPPKVRKPPKPKKADNDSKTHTNSPPRLNDWTVMFDDA